LDGMVNIWDISTGLCKMSLQTQAKNTQWSDAQLVNGRLILVWHADQKIHIWGGGGGEVLREIDASWSYICDIRISGGGSNVFCLHDGSIGAWSTKTGEVLGEVAAYTQYLQTSLIVNGSRVWFYSPYNSDHQEGPQGWDFGIPNSSPVQLTQISSLHLSDTKLWDVGQCKIKGADTGKVLLQLSKRFARPCDLQLDGQYILAYYRSGEVLILDFNHVPLW